MIKSKKIFFTLAAVLTASVVMLASSSASALSGSEFKADRIIDDALFYTGNAMTADQIQIFLNAKVPTCDTNGEKMYNSTQTRAQWAQANGKPLPPYKCLKDFKQSYDARSDSGLCSYLPSGIDRTAAQIIDAVARSCNISQKVLIVMLQKEQSLITDDWPWPVQYDKAMGYYCPDDPARPGWCHPDYAGFFNQVYNAAKQFNRYKQFPADWNHAHGRTSHVAYQANAPSCGGTDLTMQTAGTAGLYNYTPYQPNAAALTNLYGTGDNCSAYGNRNFWRMYNDWFGKTIVEGDVWYGWRDISIDNTGDFAEIPIILTKRPTSTVRVDFKVSDTSRATIVRNGSLFFTPDNYNRMGAHSVVVQGIGNTTLSSAILTLEVTSVSSSDPLYANTPLGYYSKQSLYWLNQNERSTHRLYSSTTNRHAYASTPADISALVSKGFADEGVIMYQCTASMDSPLGVNNNTGVVGSLNDPLIIYGGGGAKPGLLISNGAGTVGTYLLRRSDGNTVITTSIAEKDYAQQSLGYSFVAYFGSCKANDQPVFRFYNPTTYKHFYTSSTSERFSAFIGGFSYEGLGYNITSGGTIPVHRLYSPSRGAHFYTISDSEKVAAQSQGYNYEGVGFNITSGGTIPVHRLYSPSRGAHFYTISDSEKVAAQGQGYNYEGVGYYSQP